MTSKEYLTNGHILLKYLELVFLKLHLIKISCKLITIRLSYKRNKKVPFLWNTVFNYNNYKNDRWRHVTPKSQGRDPIIFEAPYLRNGARWTHGHYGPPIGIRPSGVKCSRDRWRHVSPKGQVCNPIIFEALYLHRRMQDKCMMTMDHL